MSDRRNLLQVDGERLWRTLTRSGEIGPGRAGGLCRLPLTAADKEMRDQFVENEHIEPEYTIPAVNVLLHAVLERANR